MLLDTFLLLKAEQARQKEQQKDNWHDNDYLFTAYGGLPMGHNTPTRWFKDFLADQRAKQQWEQTAAGIPVSEQKLFPKMRFHDLRHIHASLLIGKGVDIQTVSRRLGHARASTTANIYGHPLMANDAKAAAIIETEFK
jgi:integrase